MYSFFDEAKRLEDPGGSGPDAAMDTGGLSGWAVPWADLMMVVFVLFVVLYVYAQKHKDVLLVFTDRAAAANTLDVAPLEGLLAKLVGERDIITGRPGPGPDDNQVFYKSRDNGVSVLREPDRVRVTVRGSVFFDRAQTDVNETGLPYLSEIAEVMRLVPGQVRVTGYTDGMEPGGAEGFRLSAQRAASVVQYFIEHSGIDADRFSVTGRSATRPEQPSTSMENENLNCRVEIEVMIR